MNRVSRAARRAAVLRWNWKHQNLAFAWNHPARASTHLSPLIHFYSQSQSIRKGWRVELGRGDEINDAISMAHSSLYYIDYCSYYFQIPFCHFISTIANKMSRFVFLWLTSINPKCQLLCIGQIIWQLTHCYYRLFVYNDYLVKITNQKYHHFTAFHESIFNSLRWATHFPTQSHTHTHTSTRYANISR